MSSKNKQGTQQKGKASVAIAGFKDSLNSVKLEPWWIAALAIPAAASFGVMAEADRVAKQYADLILFTDRCQFYKQSSGLMIALAHQHPVLARALFPNESFPEACVHAFYSPMYARQMRENVNRVLPRLYQRSLPENGGLNLTAAQLVEGVMRDLNLLKERSDAAEVLPCPIPPPKAPLHVAWFLAAGFAAVGVTSLATGNKKHLVLAFVVGALIGMIICQLRQAAIMNKFKKYSTLCAALV